MVKSPCVNQCALDDDGVCMACNRTREEIVSWGSMTPEERERRMQEIQRRREQSETVNSV